MGRPRIRAGEFGAIQITRLAAGSYRARARARDDAGKLHQLVVVADTEDAARLALQRKVEALSTSTFAGVTGANTIAEVGASWLEQVRARAIAGSLTFSTYESYETVVRCVLLPQCGGITLDALTVGRCDRIIQAIMLQRSVSAARRARVVLGQICGYAVRDDAIRYNPVRDVQRLPLGEKKTSILIPAQIVGIRELMQHWRETPTNGPRPDYRALIDGMDIMLGTSARVGECIGLRRCDVDMTTAPPTLLINGTIVQTKEHGITRKDSPKRTRQRRRVSLPALAAAAVRRRLALAESSKDALLFATKNGNPISVSNYERLLRSFIDDNFEELEKLDVEVGHYSTHIYRRTTATLVERAVGLTLASRLLGHASEQITRTSYVVSAEQVDPITVGVLDGLLGS
ncbi:tyrosine-type recombinase/integrase [Glaciihabitans sp. INWT7]|uniref:tyrosine-type recombinase/integrase n=1 Tax=Glaciihabitans sp. INWT7 TaxID=2596912 RepID=UPI00162829A6|nr:tyrosine-type recombinase/integrase [Glaciihabitans sp. INWT7]QNE46117.1 tyrosine-type recombinase/integrase [Glaciihabitans sp. INWT7]